MRPYIKAFIQLVEKEIKLVPEHRFHPTRKWRIDYANIENKIGIELEGGVYTRGRHTRSTGFIKDCEKYNTATSMGWKIFRFPYSTIEKSPHKCAELVVSCLA